VHGNRGNGVDPLGTFTYDPQRNDRCMEYARQLWWTEYERIQREEYDTIAHATMTT
jgi:hypothetical protein